MIKRFVFGALCVVGIAVNVTTTPVAAQDYQLEQVILGIDCALTPTSNARGTVANLACQPQNPLVGTAVANSGRPTITGLYDAVYGSSLRIQLNGVWYTLGSSPALTVSGNTWTLNLGSLSPPLSAGTYDIVVQHTLTDGTMLSDTSTNELVVPVIAVTSPTVNPVTSIDGRPVINGTYDAVNTQTLTVVVGGISYVLGSSPELTTTGNTWTLNLSSLPAPLAVGAYDVTATLTAYDGRTFTDMTTRELVVQRPDADAPTINPIEWVGGRPIITGTYDAANTQAFRVFLGGRWYVLGVDPELTASGNTWRLDLSSSSTALAPGIYDVVAQATSRDGSVFGDTTTNELVIKPETIVNVITHPTSGPLANTGINIYKVVAGVLLLAAVSTLILGIIVRKRRSTSSL